MSSNPFESPDPSKPAPTPATDAVPPTPAPEPRLTAPRRLAIAAIVVTGVVTAIQLLTALTAAEFTEALTRAGGNVLNVPITVHALIEIPWYPALLAAYIVLSLWFYRANAFMSQQGTPQRFKKIWAWFMWLVPFANLVIPHMFMRSIASEKQKSLVAGWWGGYLVWAFGERATGIILEFGTEVPETFLASYSVIYWIRALALTASWVCLAKIIRDFTDTHASPRPQSTSPTP